MKTKKSLKVILEICVVIVMTTGLVACQKDANTTSFQDVSSTSESSSMESQEKEHSWLSGNSNFKTISATSLEKNLQEEMVSNEVIEEPAVEEAEEPMIEEEPFIEESVVSEPFEEELEPEPVYTYEVKYEESVVPMPIQYVGDPNRDNDHMPIIKQEGQDGKMVHTWLYTYEDGVLIDSAITKTSQIDPIPEIISIGINIVVIPENSSYEKELAKMKELFPSAFD